MHPLPRISDKAYTVAPCATKPVSQIVTRRDGQDYIDKTIVRLCIFDDVQALTTPQAIAAALDRWRHCFHAVQVAKLQDWLDAQPDLVVSMLTTSPPAVPAPRVTVTAPVTPPPCPPAAPDPEPATPPADIEPADQFMIGVFNILQNTIE